MRKLIALVIVLFFSLSLVTHVTLAAPVSCESVIRAAEAGIRSTGPETAIVFSPAPDCKAVATFKSFIENDGPGITGNWPGYTLTHSHIDLENLSGNDLYVAAAAHFHSVRVVKANGVVCALTAAPGQNLVLYDFAESEMYVANLRTGAELPNYYRYAADHGWTYWCS